MRCTHLLAALIAAHITAAKPLAKLPGEDGINDIDNNIPDSTGPPSDGSNGQPLKNPHQNLEAGASTVPYSNGLTLGQGYNTYLQEGCMNGAVDVTGSTNAPGQVTIEYRAIQITEYSQIIKELGISASLGIQYLDDSVEVSGKMLDKSTISWKEVRFMLRAKVAFGMFGVGVSVSTEMKKASEFLSKNSKVTSEMFWVGAPPKDAKSGVLEQMKSLQSGEASLLDIKSISDKFIAEAGDHQWKRYALVERYDQVFNFKDEFTPLDYSDAIEQTWAVFDDYATYDSMQRMLKTIKLPETLQQKQVELRNAVLKAKDAVKIWINNVSKDPSKATAKPSYQSPDEFLGSVMIIDDKLRTDIGKTTAMFNIRGVPFPGVTGTSKLTFGHEDGEPWWDITTDGTLPANFKEQSHVWLLNKKTPTYSQPIYVYKVIDKEKGWWNRIDVNKALPSNPTDIGLNLRFFTKAE
ncbi:uncharacterized protein BBA_03708 [Beauveria bassiana ARSEF 2860]|uniref:Uncharacterized protein n=1 Tax=Beauveria bassiana (strain ARSEF 2860) TaxID=655819 RepID=J4KPA9_BEAB2|nr:uncharacterized protein BBA_03708 [Beauveria bassiana ARSEF 2860]EJP67134.1 hypothetical protein BBA_03708 [Beauveria bassiana ARSEF 2860]